MKYNPRIPKKYVAVIAVYMAIMLMATLVITAGASRPPVYGSSSRTYRPTQDASGPTGGWQLADRRDEDDDTPRPTRTPMPGPTATRTPAPTVQPTATAIATPVATGMVFRRTLHLKANVMGLPGQISFSRNIKPILSTCTGCHGTLGGVTLSSYSGVRNVVVPGNAQSSPLYQSLTENGDDQMPPGGSLPGASVQMIADWINQGALNN